MVNTEYMCVWVAGTPPADRPQMVFHDGFHASAPLSHSAPGQTLVSPPTLFSIFFDVGVSGDPAFNFCEGIQPKPRARRRCLSSQNVKEGSAK